MEYISILYALGLGIGGLLVIGGFLIGLLTVSGLSLILVFWKTRKILIPTTTMFILSIAEIPMSYIFSILDLDDSIISNMVIDVRNILYRDQYEDVPYEQRAVFIPQCLRSPKCPAPLTPEGIMCIGCGKCGLGKLKEETEQLGTKFFIAPGSSLIKRMIKQYRPKAILGVGCHLEVKEGIDLIRSINLPVQGIKLACDGCVNTRVDIKKTLEMIITHSEYHRRYKIDDDPKMWKRACEIADMWGESKESDLRVLAKKKG